MYFQLRQKVEQSGNLLTVYFTIPQYGRVTGINGQVRCETPFSVNDGVTVVTGVVSDGIRNIPVEVKIAALNQPSSGDYVIQVDTDFVTSGSFSLSFYMLMSSYVGDTVPFKAFYEVTGE